MTGRIVRGPLRHEPRALKSGLYYTPMFYYIDASVAVSANVEYAVRFEVGVGTTFDRIAIEVVGSAASSTVRLGIRADLGGYPDALILDAGTVDSSSTGAKAITISQFLAAGRYWVSATAQGGAPTLRHRSPDPYVGSSSASAGNHVSYSQSGITGALPSTFTSTVATSLNGPVVKLRVA